jgi:hypothetical protein
VVRRADDAQGGWLSRRLAGLFALLAWAVCGPAAAGASAGPSAPSAPSASSAPSAYCDAPPPLTAGQQGRLLRAAAVLADALEASGRRVAIVSRSGLDLRWFGQRYSHAGISLKASPGSPWAVRQLYYACDEKQPRLFDQGLAAFVLGTDR